MNRAVCLLLLAAACSSSKEPTIDPKQPGPAVADGPIGFYCATDSGACVLAAKAGSDAFAARYTARCTGHPCEPRDGAWCLDVPPASSMRNPFREDKSACFVDEERCAAHAKAIDTSLVCAPMSAKIANEHLEDSGRKRVAALPIDYYCTDIGEYDICFLSSWACLHRKHEWLAATKPCTRAERMWCNTATMAHSDPAVEFCTTSEEVCEMNRKRHTRAFPGTRATPCETKANPAL